MNSLTPQLDTVLALAERLQTFVAVREQMKGTDPEIITVSDGVPLTMSDLREAINAIHAAVGGEAVAVAWRFVDKTGQYAYSSWVDIGTPIGDHDASRIAIQYAYASPATVGVGFDTDDYEACKQLLAEIREAAGLKEKPGSILERIRELAALIGEEA